MTIEWYVLVCVCGLAIDVKTERSVLVADDGYIKHCYSFFFFDFFCPLDVWMNGIEIVV